MRIVISDSGSFEVAVLTVQDGAVSLEGTFPGGLTHEDLEELGFVYYQTDERGDIVSRVREVHPDESLDYVRAVQDALPPGFHISRVDSARIEEERQARRRRFEEELARIVSED